MSRSIVPLSSFINTDSTKMPLLSRSCNHVHCTNLVFSQDTCHMHNGGKVNVPKKKKKRSPIDTSRRTISVSRDGTSSRAYKQCSHKGCKNIAKKFGKCYSHGAPRKVCNADGCNSNAQKLGLCRKHYSNQELTPIMLAKAGWNICGDTSMDESSDAEFWEEFVAAFT